MTTARRKLIEVALPLEAINVASAREKSIRHGHPSTLHLWWARRPLAACRAVLFAQLVDDPSAWPDLFPTEDAQDRERQRLFKLIEDIVPWEATSDEEKLAPARQEIARSFARGRKADGVGDHRDDAVLADGASAKVIGEYLATVVPPVHDPFAGGGSIPLEAQRLGLRAIATDLNPVAVLINKAQIEIPALFAGQPPVGPVPPDEKQGKMPTLWPGASGLAEDVRRYGAWMRAEAFKRIGHLYPQVDLPKEHGGGKGTVIAWLWARTVESPNPAFRGVHVPLVSSFWLASKPGKETWVEPVVGDDRKSYRFEIRTGSGGPSIKETVNRGGGICLMSGEPMPFTYIRDEAKAGRMGSRLMAIVVEGKRQRIYLPPDVEHESLALGAKPEWTPDTDLPEKALGFRIQEYGMLRHADLFTARQTCALSAFGGLVQDVRNLGEELRPGYGDAIAVYCGLAVGRSADFWTSGAKWSPQPKNELVCHLFTRHAISMTWDYAEANPFCESGGNFEQNLSFVIKALQRSPCQPPSQASQRDATAEVPTASAIVATDPPYYDNVPYADLSDFFYIWHRYALRKVLPALMSTVLVPKASELVAEPYRHGGRDQAERFFESGMSRALERMSDETIDSTPVTIYYAFKQSETTVAGTTSTGWETFLQAILASSLTIVGTWPMTTERASRTRGQGSNALASSVVLVCRKRPANAPTVTRGTFRRLLRDELPDSLRALEKGNIAPVDMAQASIGPGMAIFSRHKAVLEADDKPMNVRAALQLIHEVADELRGEEEGELDRETRFAVTWFETRGFEEGAYGEAEVLATARAVSVQAVAEAGLLRSAGGRVRLLPRPELPAGWDPMADRHPTVWEAVQHLIKRLDDAGEAGAAKLLARLGPLADDARRLAYRLYTVCERKGWAEEGRAYNGLVISWPDLERLASTMGPQTPPPAQGRLF
jgi:putative DNA methylase